MLEKPSVIKRYRLHIGTIAWILHRVTGLLLVFYLMLHIWVTHHLSQGPAGFNKVMKAVQSPLFLFLEIGLLGCVLYHAFNGLRIIIVEFSKEGVEAHKQIFAAMMAVALFLFLVGGVPMFVHFLHTLAG
ncbi:MAG: succinate dehydrogenase, cytochrome b556 subunit [Aquificota bacterium]|nr:MAG: succinate dehydrogenase, cytochrome b556 subunit [Aquificota bacterium]